LAEARQISNSRNTSIPTVEVSIEGQALSRSYKLIEFIVVKEVNRIAFAKLLFADGDVATGKFPLSDSDLMDSGKEIQISCGYSGNLEGVFKGIVWKHRIIVKNNQSVLQVEARDKAVLMTMSENNMVFEEMNDGDIIEDIASRANQEVDISASFNIEHEKMVQYGSTDWDFIISRVEANAFLARTEMNTLEVFEPDTSQDAKIDLVLGATILELDTELSSENQVAGIEKTGWFFDSQEVKIEEPSIAISESGSLSSEEIAENISAEKSISHYSNVDDDKELTALADAEKVKNKLSRIRGFVKSEGFAEIKPGEMIKLSSVGEKFNGKTFVSAVTQTFKNGNWTTSYQVGLSEEFHLERFSPKPKTQFVLPVTNGLEIGVVQEIVDPNGENRIKINIATFENTNGIWARHASPDAGDGRGIVFRPEVGDEVVVAFINNDPRAAVILGMLNSSAKPSPIDAEEDNNEKGIVTRKGLKLIFNDDDLSTTVETPNGNTIVLSDDEGYIKMSDENGNTVEMSEDGIKLDSIKDVEIKATGDVKLEGTNIEFKANASFKAEGSASAEVSSSGATAIKGSLVQIN
jgi:Rhs element Vgr protein